MDRTRTGEEDNSNSSKLGDADKKGDRKRTRIRYGWEGPEKRTIISDKGHPRKKKWWKGERGWNERKADSMRMAKSE